MSSMLPSADAFAALMLDSKTQIRRLRRVAEMVGKFNLDLSPADLRMALIYLKTSAARALEETPSRSLKARDVS